MLQITTRDQEIAVEQWTTLIYGSPGIGKTSTAFTSDKPILLDFDSGAHRSEFRKDVVRIKSWDDISSMTAEDLKGYNTLCVDTVGRLLDVLTINIVSKNSKLGTKAGGLTLQGYGVLKSEFASWIKSTHSMGLNILLLAHEKEERKGDDVILRPDIVGGSFGEVFKVADQAGYLHKNHNNHRVLDFEPSDSWYGKNTGRFPPLMVPSFHADPDWMKGIGDNLLQSMNTLSAEGKQFADQMIEVRSRVEAIDLPEDLSMEVFALAETEDSPTKILTKHLVQKRAKDLGFKWDKEANAFAAPVEAKDSEETPEEIIEAKESGGDNA
jgi:hypothetical protein